MDLICMSRAIHSIKSFTLHLPLVRLFLPFILNHLL